MKHYVFKFAGNTNFAYLRVGMLSNLLKERYLFTVQILNLVNYGEENGSICYR